MVKVLLYSNDYFIKNLFYFYRELFGQLEIRCKESSDNTFQRTDSGPYRYVHCCCLIFCCCCLFVCLFVVVVLGFLFVEHTIAMPRRKLYGLAKQSYQQQKSLLYRMFQYSEIQSTISSTVLEKAQETKQG